MSLQETAPFFSVIIPTYNRSKAVVKAIESVLKQTYTNFEVLVIDDGSTDNTSIVTKTLSEQDNRIVYIFQENQERSAARNNGVAIAKGEFVCFLDSDDALLPNHLAQLAETIDRKHKAIALYHVHGELRNKEKATPITFPEHVENENNLNYVLSTAIIPTSFVCVSKEILEKHRFNTDLYVGEDRELWSRIVTEYPIILSNQQTVVQYDLGDRTVDISNLKTAKENLRTTQLILKRIKTDLPRKLQKQMLSSAYFKLAQSYDANNKYAISMAFTLRAIITHQNEYTPSLVIFLIKTSGLSFLLPSRFK
jgi:glycosyltransferase involved in cell wall biosynthesis